ncbi:uncharacterized protein LTR77_007587 [Saxophila tyrrhenica]|uniref:Heterokaryon incompatibility domain-containing protein n=1 Tax=Saxophila tyrrhenica TaxID=1690608 RepID=A0AAV9P6I2_9PEZI|nr:hypothetical protein LTR77_007587 [Saxophila tyrrhenica]
MESQQRFNVEQDFYSPIQPGEIRVLKAVSIKDLSFELQVVPLDKPPKYGALSYVWGDSTLCRQILLQGKPFWVTGNLFIALDRFRRGFDGNSVAPLKKPIWIDALCINQSDSEPATAERGAQVQRMAEIYHSAEMVYAWLGQPSDERCTRLAAAKMAEFERLFTRYVALRKKSKDWEAVSQTSNLFQDLANADAKKWTGQDESTIQAWQGVAQLWKSQWFRRAWTQQEGTVPEVDNLLTRRYETILRIPKKMVVKTHLLFGNAHTTWTAITAAWQVGGLILNADVPGSELLKDPDSDIAFQRLFEIRFGRALRLKAVDRFDLLETINRWYMLRKKSLFTEAAPMDPLETLNKFRLAECRDARDKVFAAMGLLPSLRARMQVDYKRSTLDTYICVVSSLLAAPGASLDFLGYVNRTPSLLAALKQRRPDTEWENFPSWLPNWCLPLKFPPLPKDLHVEITKTSDGHPLKDKTNATKGDTRTRTPVYNACGRQRSPDIVIQGRLLRSSGQNLDTVSGVMWLDTLTEESSKVLARWQISTDRYLDDKEFYQVRYHVSCADVKYKTGMEVSPVDRGYAIGPLIWADKATLTEEQLVEQSIMTYTYNTLRRYRALCITARGRLGLVFASTVVGDSIVALAGGQVLYVLRHTGTAEERDEYIGEAYVHGLMDGEVDGLVERGEVSTQTFVIQ